MNDVFRFITVRPPQAPEQPATVSLPLSDPYKRLLLTELATTPPASTAAAFSALKRVTLTHFGAAGAIGDIGAIQLRRELAAFEVELRPQAAKATLASVSALIPKHFANASAATLVGGQAFKDDLGRIGDHIVGIILTPEAQRQPIGQFVRFARTAALLQRAAAGDLTLDAAGAVAAALDATLVLPEPVFPLNRRQIQPVGVADLLVVKQQLKRYELGDISHIENVLRGESKTRTLTHKLATEQTFLTETETTTEESKDLQTTDRFELKTEAEKTLKEDLSIKAGVSVTAKYGDSLQVNANADVAYSTARTEAVKQASSFGRDVTSRAASKVTERVKRQETRKITESFEEVDGHGFDNADGAGHVSGVYQWVNKVYEAQVFNYGKRLLFDIVVPEPGAFLLDMVAAAQARSTELKPPAPFDVLPNLLTDIPTNPHYYQKYVTAYGASGVAPLGLFDVTVTKAYSEKTEENDPSDQLVKDFEIKVPDGYIATGGHVTAMFNYKNNDPAKGLRIFVGNALVPVLDQTGTRLPFNFPPNGEVTELVPIAVETKDVKDYSLTIVVNCKMSPRTLERWKLDTHAKILEAYNARLSEYNASVAARSFQRTQYGPLGANPLDNRRTERVELKKAAIGMLTGQDLYDQGWSAMTQQAQAPLFPRPDLGKTEGLGRFVRFFEQAFEWEQMMYYFYPYYWGRKETWYDKAQLANTDPLFADFLRAGAARCVIPVRPTFEAELRYYLMTGQIWGGGGLPEVTDSTYLPITEEIKESTGAPGAEQPQGDPWDVRLPTTLVKLRADDRLPEWMKTSVGGRDAWVPAKRDAQGVLQPE